MNKNYPFLKALVYSAELVVIMALVSLLMFTASFLSAQSMTGPFYAMAFVISAFIFFGGMLIFTKIRDLKETKINLTKTLENSEKNLEKVILERDRATAIVNNFNDGLIILDEKNIIISINPEAEKFLGHEVYELLGKSSKYLSDFLNDISIVSVLNLGLKDIFKKQIELKKDFVVELSIIPFSFGKNIIAHSIVLHDISREKKVEKIKTEFVSLAAHQLRTPLSITKWSMSMLKRGDFGNLNRKQAEVVSNTYQNNERLIHLVNDLLDVTRFEEGRYLYNITMSDMKKVVATVISNLKDEIESKKIKILFSAPDNLPQTMFDEEKIGLVVQNLIDNAIKYSDKNGNVMITIGSDEKNIEFKIKDFGIGIPETNKDKIFMKFSRGDNAAGVNTVGSGLGLFLAKNIIEDHEGKIWFESEENSETNFYFSLPIKKVV